MTYRAGVDEKDIDAGNEGGLENDEIEIPKRLAMKLLKGERVKKGENHKFIIEERTLTGFPAYWYDPDKRTEFSNRFAVKLSVFLTLLAFALQGPWSFIESRL